MITMFVHPKINLKDRKNKFGLELTVVLYILQFCDFLAGFAFLISLVDQYLCVT